MPGQPPAILINETYAACGTAAAANGGQPRVTPYLAVPDAADCSAFWLRICLADEPSLSYVLCPGDTKYFSNKKSLTCYNQGSTLTFNLYFNYYYFYYYFLIHRYIPIP